MLLVGAYLFGGWSHYKAAEKAHLADRFLTVAAPQGYCKQWQQSEPRQQAVSSLFPQLGLGYRQERLFLPANVGVDVPAPFASEAPA